MRLTREPPAPVEMFFRDDDAGWADDRLLALLDLLAAHELPLDLAVIPAALTHRLAAQLLGVLARHPRVRPGTILDWCPPVGVQV